MVALWVRSEKAEAPSHALFFQHVFFGGHRPRRRSRHRGLNGTSTAHSLLELGLFLVRLLLRLLDLPHFDCLCFRRARDDVCRLHAVHRAARLAFCNVQAAHAQLPVPAGGATAASSCAKLVAMLGCKSAPPGLVAALALLVPTTPAEARARLLASPVLSIVVAAALSSSPARPPRRTAKQRR